MRLITMTRYGSLSLPLAIAAALTLPAAASAQPSSPAKLAAITTVQATPSSPTQPASPDSLILYFNSNSTTIRQQDQALLDQAARLYRDGNPVLMTLTGQADNVGPAASNLQISSRRALAVLYQLVARGIPAQRFELVAKGTAEEPVAQKIGDPEPLNRRVEIRWR